MAGLIWLLAVALSAGGFGPGDLLLVVLFAVTLPWSVIGFWNATIGLLIMRFARDPVAAVTPAAGARRRATSRSSRRPRSWSASATSRRNASSATSRR